MLCALEHRASKYSPKITLSLCVTHVFIRFRGTHGSAQLEGQAAKKSSQHCITGWPRAWCKRVASGDLVSGLGIVRECLRDLGQAALSLHAAVPHL